MLIYKPGNSGISPISITRDKEVFRSADFLFLFIAAITQRRLTVIMFPADGLYILDGRG